MTCPELIPAYLSNKNLSVDIDFKRYMSLHPAGKNLILGWFNRAWEMRNNKDEYCFEPFIFLWIAFNAWAACVTGLDEDSKWKTALMEHNKTCNKFDEFLKRNNSNILSSNFYDFWPIFKSQEIRRNDIIYSYKEIDRKDIIDFFFTKGVQKFEPNCWKRHLNADERPLDWPHTLAALYRVRCNLFHGEKAVHSEMDKLIVSIGFRVLLHFLKEEIFVD